MKHENLYLDNAATTPLSAQVRQSVISMLDNFYNPASVYQSGRDVKKIIERSRDNVAKFINTDSDDIYFTSGGSASNTLAIRGYLHLARPETCVFYSPIVHKSIIKCIDDLSNRSFKIPINENGLFDLNKLSNILPFYKHSLVVVDYANSEIGTIQDIKTLSDITHECKSILYVDCTGSIPTIPLDVKELNIDMAGFSAHKLGALKGCGVLYKSTNIELEPLIYGSQESGLFGGTENVLGIVALGTAVENYEYSSLTSYSRDYVLNYMEENISNFYLVGSKDNRLINNLYLCIKGVNGNQLMATLDMDGIQISTGSACNNYSPEPSTVLTEIGIDQADLQSCIRITFSCHETKDQLDYLCQRLKQNIDFLRNVNE